MKRGCETLYHTIRLVNGDLYIAGIQKMNFSILKVSPLNEICPFLSWRKRGSKKQIFWELIFGVHLWSAHVICAMLGDMMLWRQMEKEMATHSRILAWRIPRTGEPGGLLSMGSHRVRHDWSDLAAAAGHITSERPRIRGVCISTFMSSCSVLPSCAIWASNTSLPNNPEMHQTDGPSGCFMAPTSRRQSYKERSKT